jgi:molecular chaperone HscB
MEFFSLFGLPIRYELDDALLTVRYQDLQRQFHPDRYAMQPEDERLLASQRAADLNQAYQTLKHPLRRAEYLLSLQGIDISSEQFTLHDTVFLSEQLALHEELDDIGVMAQAETALDAFSKRLAKMNARRGAEMAQRLDAGEWAAAADSVRKLRFLDRLRQQVDQLEDSLLDR